MVWNFQNKAFSTTRYFQSNPFPSERKSHFAWENESKIFLILFWLPLLTWNFSHPLDKILSLSLVCFVAHFTAPRMFIEFPNCYLVKSTTRNGKGKTIKLRDNNKNKWSLHVWVGIGKILKYISSSSTGDFTQKLQEIGERKTQSNQNVVCKRFRSRLSNLFL